MKTRMGFVSNSSSSSFLIYGIEGFRLENPNEDGDCLDEISDAIYTKAENAGLESYNPDGCDGFYIGKSLADCPDDMTMGDFKKEIEEKINNTFGEQKNFDIHEVSWYS